SGRGVRRSMTGQEASEEPPHGAVARDDQQWQDQDGPGRTTAPALSYVRSKAKLRTSSSTRVPGLRHATGTTREQRTWSSSLERKVPLVRAGETEGNKEGCANSRLSQSEGE